MTDWPTLIRDHGPLLWRTSCRLLDDHADASDCFQRTFLAAVELDERVAVRSWPAVLKRVATTRALETLRTRYRGRATGPLPEFTPDERATDPSEFALHGELAEHLRAALADLDPAQASAFCLVALEGLTNTEAAEQLGVTPNHVGVLLHRARHALRTKLSGFDPKVIR